MQICNIEATEPSFSFKLPHVTYHLLHAIEQEHEFCSFRTTATKKSRIIVLCFVQIVCFLFCHLFVHFV